VNFCVSKRRLIYSNQSVFAFDDSSIEKIPSKIIGGFGQVEQVFSVSRMAVFGNQLIVTCLDRVDHFGLNRTYAQK